MCDHHYSSSFENKEEEYLGNRLDTLDQNSDLYIKSGDELLIDMVRARPYLYDKTIENYKDATMKETAWTEIATTLNITRK